MKKPLLILSAAFLLLYGNGCQKHAPASHSQLGSAVSGLSSSPPCDSIIPMEWAASWPMPTGNPSGKEFSVFFYPLIGNQETLRVYSPAGKAVFTIGEAASVCEKYKQPPTRLSKGRWPADIETLSMPEFEARSEEFYHLTERINILYSSKKTGFNREEEALLRDYQTNFERLAEPALLAHYQAMSAEFLSWLKASQKRVP